MRYMKDYKKFTENIDSALQFDDQTMPEYNPDLNLRAKKYVEENIIGKNYKTLFEIADMPFPEDVSKEEMIELEELAKTKAIQYFIDNPEMMVEPDIDTLNSPLNTVVPALQNI